MFRRKGIVKDLKAFFSLKAKRVEAINNTTPNNLPTTYGVNELASSLHPGFIKAKVSKVVKAPSNTTIITLEANKFPYFKAGQFVTLSLKIGNSLVTRPYSIYSSPKDALNGILEVAVQKAGFFSNELSNIKVGSNILVGEPSGDFYYDDLRDKKNILAIAGGSGITPFVSMAKALNEESDDFNLTILYGVKTLSDMIYDFKDIKSDKVKVIPVLSNEEKDGYLHGFITKDILKDHLNDNVSVFMCGPDAMYDFVKKEIVSLGYNEHRIRQEHNSIKDLDIKSPKEFKLVVHMKDEIFTIKALENETLLVAMEKAGLCAPSRCRSGVCGFCHSRLISGDINTPNVHDHRRLADVKFGYIHPCATYPLSDLEIDVPEQAELKQLM